MKKSNLLVFHGLPLLMILFPFIWFAIVGDNRMIKGEAGIVENMTVLFLVLAIGFCILSISKVNRLGLAGFVKIWLFVVMLGSLYFALEELSYGQHMFGWGSTGGTTVETWKELNDQGETNLHNIHAIFDQVPRILLTFCILIGGVVLPLYRRFRGIRLDESSRFYWQWPTLDCLTIGVLVILIRPVTYVFETEIISVGEFKESLIALFILLYCVSIYSRLERKPAGPLA